MRRRGFDANHKELLGLCVERNGAPSVDVDPESTSPRLRRQSPRPPRYSVSYASRNARGVVIPVVRWILRDRMPHAHA
jgi:hypothetical protein